MDSRRREGGGPDWGLVYASIARELGGPAVMVDTAKLAWAIPFYAGEPRPCVGHVLVGVFVTDR